MSAEELFSKLFGKSVKDAEQICNELGYTMRIVRVDGRACIGTRDVRMDRINVHIVGGMVESYSGMG